MDERFATWLRDFLQRHRAVAGSVHIVEGDHLALAAAVNLPPKVIELTGTIPLGKGMAGLAWQHDKPIQTCNLQDDTTGAVKAGAKAVDGKAAVAMPVHDQSGTVRAIVGLAWLDERELPADELAAIDKDAASLPEA
jgi:L-methionine (R)-S-oxide reductase